MESGLPPGTKRVCTCLASKILGRKHGRRVTIQEPPNLVAQRICKTNLRFMQITEPQLLDKMSGGYMKGAAESESEACFVCGVSLNSRTIL